MSGGRLRLDEELVRRGLFVSRARARDAILRGTVTVSGVLAAKPGMAVAQTSTIEVDDPARGYVSRAALKLVHALDIFAIDVIDRNCLDVGASTGGFTQVLLKRGARHVTALDVGHGQMNAGIAADPRVQSIEGLNARDLVPDDLAGHMPDLVVSDVSFISLRLALPPALDIARPGAVCILLVKPQFEAGRSAIGKGGMLRDPGQAAKIASELRTWLDELPGWRATGLEPSPIDGGDGNREFLLAGKKAP